FLNARPREERVAIALWDHTLRAVDLPTRDRGRSLERLRSALTAPPVEMASEALPILGQARDWARSLAGDGQALMRSVVLWAPGEREEIAAPPRAPDERSAQF